MPNSSGPSTSTLPYLIGEPNVTFTSILTVGDQVGFKSDGITPWLMVGIPDGLGAFDNGDGTMTVLMNQELGNTVGVAREHGGIGSFVSQLTIDKATLQVTFAQDLIHSIQLWDTTTSSYITGTNVALSRLCSGDLPAVNAFYNPLTGLGTTDRIFMSGEETGAEGRAFAHVVTGTDAHISYELAALGNTSFENIVASPNTGDKTVILSTDDSTPGQVYLYIGDKQATGTTIEKAGLTNGQLYGIAVTGLSIETAGTTIPGGAATFSLKALGDVTNLDGATLQTNSNTAGVTQFFRPEDITWDTINPNRAYFVTTANVTSPSRLYALDFTDINNPTAGGNVTLLLDGSEGQRMFDNITVDGRGHVLLQEDVGNNVRTGLVWDYDPTTDKLIQTATHDPALFGSPTQPATLPFNIDEESSGIIDVTSLLGDANTHAYLLDVQAHYAIPGELVEGGQLVVMKVIDPVTVGTAFNDNLFGSGADETFNGGNGNDSILAGSGKDTISGGNGNDTVDAGNGDDAVKGDAGSDSLSGGAGNDNINGGGGDDILIGGAGKDVLTGGVGADMFKFLATLDSAVGQSDVIKDFKRFQGDLIDLSSIDADTTQAGDQGFTFTNRFHNVAGELYAISAGASKSIIYGDINGDGSADFIIELTGTNALIAADFVL